MVKTLTVTEDAYERLANRKEAGESFSDVIKKLTGKNSLFDLVGVLTESETLELEKSIEERRADTRKRVEKTAKSL